MAIEGFTDSAVSAEKFWIAPGIFGSYTDDKTGSIAELPQGASTVDKPEFDAHVEAIKAEANAVVADIEKADAALQAERAAIAEKLGLSPEEAQKLLGISIKKG